MSNRYEHLHYCEYRDTETGLVASNYVEVMNEQDQKIKELEAKLAESESKAKTYAKEIVFLDKKLENLNKEFELAQEHNEKTVEYWQNECSQLKQQLAEKDQAIESLQEINQSLGQTCNNDAKEIERLREQLAEKDVEIEKLKKGVYKVTLGTTPSNQIDFTENFYVIQNQTAIAVLEEMLDNEVYINSKLDFEDGNYVLSKIIRAKIEELKNGRN